jgi:hypothetical protein
VQDKKAAGHHFFKKMLPKYNAGLDGEDDAKTMQRSDHCRDAAAATAISADLPNTPLRMY